MDNTDVIKAVAKAIKKRFSNKQIYTETPQQKYKTPYFFVTLLDTTQTPDTFNKFNRKYLFDVRYHTNILKTSKNLELLEIEEGLRECLHTVDTDFLPIRALKIDAEKVDGVLHVEVEYPIRVRRSLPDKVKMKDLTQQHYIKKQEEE